MSMCESCLHNHHCTEVGKDAVTVCAMYKEQNEDNALCIYNWEVPCCYPIEDCRNCPVRNGEPPFQSEEPEDDEDCDFRTKEERVKAVDELQAFYEKVQKEVKENETTCTARACDCMPKDEIPHRG